MSWLVEHWETIAAITSAVLAIASVITGLTSTPIDNTVVDVIRKIFGQISFAQPKNSEGTLKVPGTSVGPLVSRVRNQKPVGGRRAPSTTFKALDD